MSAAHRMLPGNHEAADSMYNATAAVVCIPSLPRSGTVTACRWHMVSGVVGFADIMSKTFSMCMRRLMSGEDFLYPTP